MLLLGKPVAEEILAATARRIKDAKASPGLAVILIGEDPASHLYVGFKEAAAKRVGIRIEKTLLPKETKVERIFECIENYNRRTDIHGIIVQLPLPPGFPTDKIIGRIDPRKDTDGFHEKTLERFLGGEPEACPVFPRAVVELLRATGKTFRGKRGLVLANSEILGKVMAAALGAEGIDSEYVLSGPHREKFLAKIPRAEVLVTACGMPGLITGAMIREDTVIIDGGITEQGQGKVVGDVERESVLAKGAILSPVPGGVGPVTVACLLARVTEAALKK